MVASLLFVALAFFAVSQAGVIRNGAQGAADAGALAHAQDARDHLRPGLDLRRFKAEDWERLLAGSGFDVDAQCRAGYALAQLNDSSVTSCNAELPYFQVTVRTNYTLGSSVVPGISGKRGVATARATILDRECRLVDWGDGETVQIKCRGGSLVTFDPSSPELWAKLAPRLFDVRLID
ncbi:hypothetical protein [Streptomyces sp. NPDC006879]|uniref:hypothetical protein n=1 Tax=Streptomyces sp. NPDC006879 TaxID=3364767 RepID=UPI0036897BA3